MKQKASDDGDNIGVAAAAPVFVIVMGSGPGRSHSGEIPYEETRGPRVGVKLTIQQANSILKRHLGLDCSCTAIEYIEQGYNNRTYIARANTGGAYVIRLCGRYWDRWKTEREVATLCYIRLRCLELPDQFPVPVPKVYGFCSNREASGIGHEYILMEAVPGVSLEEVWKAKPSTAEKTHIFAQIAAILRTMKSITFDKIGSFTLAAAIGDTFGVGVDPCKDITLADICVGPQSDINAGPFENFVEYERAATLEAVEELKRTAFMVDCLDLVPRIEEFVHDQLRKDSTLFKDDASLVKPRITLTHGDFDVHNIMIHPKSLRITGVVDWEWAGAYPHYEDWFAGFEAFGAACDEAWTFGGPPTAPEDYDPRTPDMVENRKLLFAQLTAHGLPTPDQVPGLRLYAELYHFRESISPWWLREAVDGPTPPHWDADKAKGKQRVVLVLEKYRNM